VFLVSYCFVSETDARIIVKKKQSPVAGRSVTLHAYQEQNCGRPDSKRGRTPLRLVAGRSVACLPRAKLWPSSLQERQDTAASSCRSVSYIACLPRAKLRPSSHQERQDTAASSCRPVSYIACLPRAKLWPSSLQERQDTAASSCRPVSTVFSLI
jgi:hypothetical protein